jgi:O-acetyl-ADP-ribose deacetylase
VTRNYTDRIGLVVGDITGLQVDAIVTAANESLSGGGGVDGAVHRAAGPALYEECRTIGICPEGQARITGGYLLPARFVIHAVGPVYEDGSFGEAEILASAYRESLALAEAHGIGTIAFPCIATGVYGYPKPEACRVAVEVVLGWLAAHDLPSRVTFCCFEEEDAEFYRIRLDEIKAVT